MPDPRHNRLRHTLTREGLTQEERDFGTDYLEAPAAQAELLDTLLHGVLDERGFTLNPAATVRVRGLLKGRAMLDKLATDNGQCEWRPEAVLTFQEWQVIQRKMTALDMTCERLMKMLLGTKAEVRRRQTQRQAA